MEVEIFISWCYLLAKEYCPNCYWHIVLGVGVGVKFSR